MRLCILFLACSLSMIHASDTYAQTTKISIDANQQTVETVLKQIKTKTGFDFFFNNKHVDLNRRVSVSVNEGNVFDVLSKVFAGTNVKYSIMDKKIVLAVDATNGVQQNAITKVSGKVVDASGEPIIGASVVEKGTTNGVVTDINGNFTLTVNSTKPELTISYIGYKTQTAKPQAGKTMAVTLSEDTELLDEVVVVGYGTMKKKDLTGAVSSIKMGDAPVGTVSTISHALAGKAAGLQVNTVSAQPGGGSNFRIRGAGSVKAGNAPLIIIDGFPVSATDEEKIKTGKYSSGSSDNILASINPNDIESIEILKDASSTAIYGARAGNGVIIITTKKGKTGAPKVTYSGTATVQILADKYDMLNAQDFMLQSNRYAKEEWMRSQGIGIYGGKSESQAEKPYEPYYKDGQTPANNTEWFDEITRTGFQTQHNVSVNGGTETTKYLISGNFFRQNGVVKNNDLQRYTGRVNLEQKVSKYVNMGVNMTISRNQANNVPLGSGQNENASIMVAAAQFNPLLPIKDANGDYVLNSQAAFLPNPVSLLEITDKTTKERLLATAFVEVKPINDLTLKASFGIDRNYQKHSVYMPKTTLYGQKKDGQADIAQYDKSDYLMELTANYTKKIGDHNFSALVGYSFQRFTDESLGLSNSQFLSDGFLYNNIGAGAFPKPGVGSSASKDEMASFFGRVNYSFKDRYLMTATLRADGASNFAKNNRWGYFPSVALGWRFTEEEFMKPLASVLSNGKLRVSYGQTGNSSIGNRAISFYKTGNNNEFGGTENVGVYLDQLGNPDLKWETTSEWNFGLDLGFFDNRLNVTAEYFRKIISDLLSERSLLKFNEVEKIYANMGKTQSQGFELTINTTNFKTKDFSWSTDFTFSLYRDRWNTRDASWKPAIYSQYDAPIRNKVGYLSDGLIQPGEKVDWMKGALPGQVKIKDIDGYVYNEDGTYKLGKHGIPLRSGKPDGKLDEADQVIYGSEDPGYIMGFNNTLRYKNFDLNVYFYGQFDVLSMGAYQDLWLTGADGMTGIVNMYRGYNMPVSAKDVWTHENTSASRPGYFQNRSTYGIGDYYMDKSWFVRCRNITLGYTIPMKKVFANIRVYADINNPFTITPYKGLDLETDNSVWAYPNVRSFSLGLDITF